jgi:glycosyltransferase involved in cell wall biosynthesis
MPASPLFTIITATFNAADTLARTIESVDSQLCRDYEHLIIDGASSDNTLAIAEATVNPLRKIYSEPDKGLYDAMNKGISKAEGKYLIFLNAGDKFHSTQTLQLLAEAAGSENAPGIIYGQTIIVDDRGRNPRPRHLQAPRELTLGAFADGMLVCHQSFVALRNITGFYNLRYRFSADYEWCIRCLQHSRRNVFIDHEPLTDYLDGGLTTRNRWRSLRERFAIMCTYYGTFATILRHFHFAARAVKRKSL